MLVLTFDIDISTVFLDVIPGSQSSSVNTLMFLVYSLYSDGGLVVNCLYVHSAWRMQLDAWRMTKMKWQTLCLNCQTSGSYDSSLTVLTISEPADILLEGQQSRGEGTSQGEVVTLLHPCWWEGVAKLGFLLKIRGYRGKRDEPRWRRRTKLGGDMARGKD